MTDAPLERSIVDLIEPTLSAMGYELVRVRVRLAGAGPTLQVMAERADRASMTVDDCADISRAISAVLDVEDPIASAYELEVSSPGLDRPLVRPVDFERFAGFEAKLQTRAAVQGRKRFRGRILGFDDGRVRMDLGDDGEAEIDFDAIEMAKLLLTDELIAGDLRAAEARTGIEVET